MELKHSFTVPAGLDETWGTFGDLASVAECFPGATVTASDGATFEGAAKVKLGPVALQYTGKGEVLERDEASHTMRLDAKGRDKRGNGTAGAKVQMVFSAVDVNTSRVDVSTDLSVTGKPAQFGARMMQEVSDKLLGQFVDCLQTKVGTPPKPAPVAEAEESSDSERSSATGSAPMDDGVPNVVPMRGESPAVRPHTTATTPASGADDALDLGATVLPVILRLYGKQIAMGVAVLVLLRWLRGRRS